MNQLQRHDWWERRSTDAVILAVALGVYVLLGVALVLPDEMRQEWLGLWLLAGCTLSMVAVGFALLRLFISRAMRLVYRVLLLLATLALCPALTVRIHAALLAAHQQQIVRTTDTNAIIAACTYIIHHPHEFREGYNARRDDPEQLAPVVRNVNPDRISASSDTSAGMLIRHGTRDIHWRLMRTSRRQWTLVARGMFGSMEVLREIAIEPPETNDIERAGQKD